jgi:hypothetical protein
MPPSVAAITQKLRGAHFASGETSDAIETHSGEPMETQRMRRSHRQINDAPAHERAAIRDRHNGRPSIARHADAGSARKGFVSGGL